MDCLGYPAAPPCSPHLRRGRHVGAQSQDGEIFQGKIIIKNELGISGGIRSWELGCFLFFLESIFNTFIIDLQLIRLFG